MDIYTGSLLWSRPLSVMSNLSNDDQALYVSDYSGFIYGIDRYDGSIIWKYQAAIPPLTFKSEGKLVQSNKVVYLGLPGGKLIAIDSPTGGLVWESNISRSRGTTDIERANDITSHPIIDGPVIYGVTTNGDISALDRRNGKTIWTRPLSSFYGMTFDGFNLFVSHDTGSIYSVNKEDGEVKWRQAALKYRRIRAGTMIEDYIVYGDGEKPFSNIIKHFKDLNMYEDWRKKIKTIPIDGCRTLLDGKLITGKPLDPVMDLMEVPSPYLTGVFDELLQNEELVPIVQNIRGCPYLWSFCVSGTHLGKIRTFIYESITE